MTQTSQAETVQAAIASRRTLRLALGTTLSMAFSQLVGWPLAFIAAIFTMFMLALPLPVPSLKAAIKFVLALVVPAYAGILLVPFLEQARWAGVLLVVLALFGSFYYSAKGGSAVMGMFFTIGITMVVTVGSVSADVMLLLVNGLAMGAVSGIAFVFIAHALLPDITAQNSATRKAPTKPTKKPPASAVHRSAMRSLLVMLPIVVILLFSGSSIAYIAVMIKVASMAQQANSQDSRSMGREQLESTLWGGLGAVIAWQVMSIWPSLLMFSLLILLAGLIYGVRIFQAQGMAIKGGMWSYAYLTMIILITPAVMDSQTGGNAHEAFYSRLVLFLVIAVYGTLSVLIFDAFWPAKKQPNTSHESA